MFSLSSLDYHAEILLEWRKRAEFNGHSMDAMERIEREVARERLQMRNADNRKRVEMASQMRYASIPFVQGTTQMVATGIYKQSEGTVAIAGQPMNRIAEIMNPIKYSTGPPVSSWGRNMDEEPSRSGGTPGKRATNTAG